MAQEKKSSGPEEISWKIAEYTKYPRDKKWYIIASIIAIGLIIYAIIDKNYFFALIIILSSGLIIFFNNEPPKKITVTLKYDGIELGSRFYEFYSIQNFYIIYRPKENIRRLYFEFKSAIRQRLSIDLDKQDPVKVRNYLRQYIDEDLDKEHEPLSEGLAKIFRL
jgi:hypothetical protein